MAGNRRGKIKEHLEGVHRNCEWIQKHLSDSIVLIDNEKPELVAALTNLAKITNTLDEFTQNVYSTV